MSDTECKRIMIIGGGLVGALNACFLAKRGYQVDLYELRDDIRKHGVVRGRSINLTLAERGRAALRAVGLHDVITHNGVPIFSRMLHTKSNKTKETFYGRKNECILSLDRRRVNELLLTAAEEYPNVRIMFNHKFLCCDFDDGTATFSTPGDHRVTQAADLIVGCDGAHSSVRAQMMKCTKIDFSQSYLTHGYIEIRSPSKNDKSVSIAEKHLHVWSRDKFLMLTFPDLFEKCFVTTLVMPFQVFEQLTTEKALLEFFNEHFPDFMDFVGIKEEDLVQNFFSRDPLPFVSIKCKPYHIGDKGMFMGDAAHAMVPFYGQGMNCGFEDCLVFDKILDDYKDDFSKALPEFSKTRNPEVEAMVDLSLRQYTILMSTVDTKSYKMRKLLDDFLHWLMPKTWVPIYTSVAFSTMPYSQCMRNRDWQNQVLTKVAVWTGIVLVLGGVFVSYKLNPPLGFLEDCRSMGSSLIGNIKTYLRI